MHPKADRSAQNRPVVRGRARALAPVRGWLLIFVSGALAIGLAPVAAQAVPLVPSGLHVGVYANVTDPATLAVAPSGVVYVGVGGVTAGRINQVGIGGSPVVPFGGVITDPDALLFDADGALTGTAGSVLVGGWVDPTPTQGQISFIEPGETTSPLFGPTSSFLNPTQFARDSTGRLLFSDSSLSKVFQSAAGAFPSELIQQPFASPGGINGVAVDPLDRIFVSNTSTGDISIYDSAGLELVESFVNIPGATHLMFGPQNARWNGDLFIFNQSGDVFRVDSGGSLTTFATGFVKAVAGEFSPDGETMYVSDATANRIYAVPEASTGLMLALGLWLAAMVSAASRRPVSAVASRGGSGFSSLA